MEIFLIILLVIAIIYIYLQKQQKTTNTTPEGEIDKAAQERIYPYAKKMLLTKAEYSFYKILKEICDKNELLICPKVRMEDFLEVTDKQNYMKYRGYIKSRHIDFMLCDSNLRIIAGLELDDNSHKKSNVQEKDDFKNNVFKTVGLPLFRVKMSEGAYKDQLEKIIQEIKKPVQSED